MAGDWIKVEVATMQKAEVLHIAELLGISRRECVGLLCEFWGWLDANARTEFVPNLSRLSLDSVLNCTGLAACLEVVGWASWDEKGTTMRIANYEHHNGASAKTRAYEQRKKKLQRENMSPICPDETGTREEKRRVSTSLRSVDKQRATRLPDDWKPSDLDIAFAKRERPGWDDAQVARTADAFRDYWRAAPKGSKLDWSATWRTWVRKERGATKTVHDKRSAVAEAMYGNALREMGYGSSGEAIAGESTRVD